MDGIGVHISLSNNTKSDSHSLPETLNSRPLTSYKAALEFLYGRINYEKVGNAPPYSKSHFRLDRMRCLLEYLGNPQQQYSIVHVAGTKGKGTVTQLLSDCLQASGFQCGMMTSPHLRDLEERFQVAGVPASPSQMLEWTNIIMAAGQQVENAGYGCPTFFEMTTAIGFLHFAKSEVDWAVVEVGLGGRLDSTNVCEPELCVITSISLDHQLQLGSTITEIAGEKAGIIKPGIPVICNARDPDAQTVIESTARDSASTLHLVDRDFKVHWEPCLNRERTHDSVEARVVFHDLANSEASRPVTVETRLLGRHQADNIGAALAALDVLRTKELQLPAEKVAEAIRNSQVPARLQVINSQPLQVVDTAHNPASIDAGFDALAAHFPGQPIITLFASSRDKDVEGMLKSLVKRSHRIVLTAYQENPRATATAELVEMATRLINAREEQVSIEVAQTPSEAWQLAYEVQQKSAQQPILLVTGSFFLASELPVSFR